MTASRQPMISPLACMRVAVLGLALAFGLKVARAETPADPRVLATAQVEEAQAYHVGTLAYLYGFPIVDLLQNLYRETQQVAGAPRAAPRAPINQFYRFRERVTPTTAGTLRAPNSDTLYLSGWFDLRDEPVIIRAPDTAGRYYTLAITDFYSEVQHVGRRTTGTAAQDFALVGPAFKGELPAGVHEIRVPTHQAWVLGRVLVKGANDLAAARSVLEGFHAIPLSQWQRGERVTPAATPLELVEPWQPTETLEFFAVLNWWLRDNPRVVGEEALRAQFDSVGFGPAGAFDLSRSSEATRRGLQRAIEDARAMLRAASRRPTADIRNGWIFPLALGRYGHDYLMRATVAFGGYANLPEETVYAALTGDSRGQPLRGERAYTLRFPAGARPPVGAFWSLSAYQSKDFSLMPNALERYSIGDHSEGFRVAADGSFTVRLSRDPPRDPPRNRLRDRRENWLPVGEGPYYLILRLYEPGPSVLDGRYVPPQLEETSPP
ncbi:MAG: DUF1254 domain-containing protein [Gammaproteobacteria bacterium]|nr:DUF1254 domain-containing protein [Gammaproteobacteria bacterium]